MCRARRACGGRGERFWCRRFLFNSEPIHVLLVHKRSSRKAKMIGESSGNAFFFRLLLFNFIFLLL